MTNSTTRTTMNNADPLAPGSRYRKVHGMNFMMKLKYTRLRDVGQRRKGEGW